MPYSPHNKTEIVNMALAHLGNGDISDFNTQTSESARQARLHFDLTRDSMLRTHPWNFSITRVSLTLDPTSPVSGYENAFLLPVDFLKILSLNDNDAWEPSDLYAIESGKLLSDEDSAIIRYVASIEDTTKWDPLFVECFTYILASKMATKLAEAPGMGEGLRQRGNYIIGEAMKADANENRKADPSRPALSRFVNSRGRGISGRPDLRFRDV